MYMHESKELSGSKFYTSLETIKGFSFINRSNNSDNSSQEKEVNSLDELLSSIKDSQFNYFCKKCFNFPTLEFVDYSTILYYCFCFKEREKFPIEDFFNPNKKIYLYKEYKNNNESNNSNNLNNKEKIYKLRCFKHNKKIKGYKYKYYCLKCNENICEECWRDHVGECHELFIFNSLNQYTINKIKEINSILERKKNENSKFGKPFSLRSSYNANLIVNTDENECEIIPKNYRENFLKLIDTIILDFNKYPSFSHFFNIENIYNFLIDKIKNSLCKVKSEYNDNIGLFCNIDIENPYNPSNKSHYLIIIKKENENINFLKDKEIEILIGNIKNVNYLEIDSKRNVYYNDYIILIEILKKDQLYQKNYLEIEENINVDDDINNLIFLHYYNGEVKLDYGNKNYLEKNKSKTEYICNENSIDGVILSDNYKLKRFNIDKTNKDNNSIGYLLNNLKNYYHENNNSKFGANGHNFKDIYKIGEEIGNGRYGRVYEGKNKYNNEKRVIKIYNKNNIKNLLRELFKKEEDFETIYESIIKDFSDKIEKYKESMNDCDNSVKYYDYFQDNKEFKIITELCDDNLYNLLEKKKFKKFNLVEVYEIIHQLNKALKIMNGNNIIHGNINLRNIFIKYEDKEKKKFKIKLGDYGSDILISYILKHNKDNLNNFYHLFYMEENNKAPYFNKFIPNDTDPNILRYKDDKSKEKFDLWKLGTSIHYLIFNKDPYVVKENDEYKKFKLKLEKRGDDEIDNLISILLERDINKPKSWDMYFNHPFCNEKLFELNSKYNKDEKRLSINTLIINLSNKEISSLSCLTNIRFENLKILNLSTNKINNIDEIQNILCDKLENLDLSNNKIKNIECISNWKFEYLNLLNLSFNEIEEINIFNNKNVLKNLKLLLLNNNKINLEEKKELMKEIKNTRGDKITIDILFTANFY